MKRLLIFSAIALLGFVSCKKDEPTRPEVQKNMISYSITSTYMLVYFQDNVWNKGAYQHLNVNGFWHYSFEAKETDTARLIVYMGTFAPDQDVKAGIYNNGKIVAEINRRYTTDDWSRADTLTYVIK